MAERHAKFCLSLVNSTDKTYHFGVYLTDPTSPGLKSVAWKVRELPPQGQEPSEAELEWTLSYGLSISRWDKKHVACMEKQDVRADLANAYEVIITEGDVPTINPTPTGPASERRVELKNTTTRSLDTGLVVDGVLAAVQSIYPGETANFFVERDPTYSVACYRGIQEGAMVDSGMELGPMKVKYPENCTTAKVEAVMENGKYRLNDPVYAVKDSQ